MKTAGQKEGAGLLERCTPGPWLPSAGVTKSVGRTVYRYDIGEPGKNWRRICRNVENEADAELIALAYDHALFGAAVMAGKASRATGYGKDAGKPCVAVISGTGMAVEAFEVSLDAAGCPNLTPELRSALRKVVGSNG